MQKLRKLWRSRRGFTLIELIVVIAVLAILATIVVPRLGAFRDQALDTRQIANVRIAEGAAAMWLAQNGNPAAPLEWTATAGEVDGWGPYLNTWPIGVNKVNIATNGNITSEPSGDTGTGGVSTEAYTFTLQVEEAVPASFRAFSANATPISGTTPNRISAWGGSSSHPSATFTNVGDTKGIATTVASVVVRYAKGDSPATTLNLVVNGTSYTVNIEAGTSWDTYKNATIAGVTLNAGATNTISLQATNDGRNVDVDYVMVSATRNK